MRQSWWYIAGALAVVAIVSGILVQPKIVGGGIAVIALVVAFVAIPKRFAIGFSLSAALVVVAALPAGTLNFPYGNTIPGAAVTILVLVAALRRIRTLQRPRHAVLLVAYTAIVLIGSIGQSPDVFYVILAVFGVVVYAVGYSVNAAERRIVVSTVVYLAAVESVLGIAEALSRRGPLLGKAITIDAMNPFVPTLHRAQGTLGHPLMLSLLLLVALALVLVRGNVDPRLRYPLGVLFIVAIFFTGSTSPILASAVLLLYWVLVRKTIAGVVASTLVVIGGVAFVVGTWGNQLGASLQEAVFGSDASHRLSSIASIPTLLFGRGTLQGLFGTGLGASSAATTGGFGAVDNQFVTSLSEGGIIGVACLVAFTVLVLLRGERRNIPVLAAFIIMSFSFDILSWYLAAGMFFALTAGSVSARRESVLAAPDEPKPTLHGREPSQIASQSVS